MRLTPIAVVLTLVAGGFYGKLLHDRDLTKAREQALLDKPRPPEVPPPPPPVQQLPPPDVPVRRNPGKPKPTPKEAETLTLLPTEERALEPAKQLMAQGKFEAAQAAARALRGSASPGLDAAAAQLADKALLLTVLTRAIQPHPFAGAPDLVEVTLASGVTHTARVLRENDQSVVLSLADGRQLDVRPERIARRENIPASAWAKKSRGEIEKRRSELGDAGALEVYHLACEAFEVGLPELGVPLLQQALTDAGGGAVINVYGSGDLEVLHRARERMRREAGNPGVVVAEGRRPRVPREKPVAPSTPAGTGEKPPRTDVSPAPDVPVPDTKPPETKPPETKPDAEPPPEPMAGDPNVSDFDKLDRDARWRGAQQAYKDGVAMYRDGFAGQTAAQKTNIREARALLEKARGLLDELPQELGDAAQTWDQFSARVNALLRDVKKRQLATGS